MFNEVNAERYWRNKKDDVKTQALKKLRFSRNRKTGLSFEELMFLEEKSYRVLFLTVGVDEEFRDDVTLQTLLGSRDRFFRHIRDANVRNELLYGVRGLLWKIEEGDRGGGLHMHLVIFYEADRSGDVTICRRLGEYWVDRITGGLGSYYNSNAHKHNYKGRWGIAVGLIGRNNDEMRCALRDLIGLYMAKTTQEPISRDEDTKLLGRRRFFRR